MAGPILKSSFALGGLALGAALIGTFGFSARSPESRVLIDATARPVPIRELPFAAGGRSPDGHTLSINTRHLSRDGSPWLPVMGEFHYARYPADEWETEILKMKAAGVEIIGTYVFWIHHEEIEGQFDWSGQRDLRRFVGLCGRHGMYAWVRVGPWAHGEARNGGIPDWVLRAGPTRQDDPGYLARVNRFFGEIGTQLRGLYWKDGGPVIGIQIENEYSARGPRQGAGHILNLERMARAAGLDAPFYSLTGWDNAVIPPRGFVPVLSGYADGFWWRSAATLPPSANYFFTAIRCDENVGEDLRSKRPDIDEFYKGYPFFTAEMAGGMAQSYHRRPVMTADDVASMVVVKLGAGAVVYGYYMFHGGTNPDGKLSTLQESQATGSLNDLPEKGYDFQAALGEFGQMHPLYRDLKTLHLFLNDFGTQLAPMASFLPERMPRGKSDIETPRAAVRMDGDRGFLFINNYQHDHPLPERKEFQVELRLPSGRLEVPQDPATIPRGAYTIWPVNLDLGGASLRYSTAQLLTKLDDPKTLVFFAWPGIAPEFAFGGLETGAIDAPGGRITRGDGTVRVSGLQPGTGDAMRIHLPGGKVLRVLLLSREQARHVWKAGLGGRERILLSPADLWFEGDRIHVRSRDAAGLSVGMFPAPGEGVRGFAPAGQDGVFARYSLSVTPVTVSVEVRQVQEAGKADPVMARDGAAVAPEPEKFERAARWRIRVPPVSAAQVSGLVLQIGYAGDIARIYSANRLVTDEFYHGTPWEIGLWRTGSVQAGQDLELRILPLRGDAPIYLPLSTRPVFPADGQIAQLKRVTVVPEYEAVLRVVR